MLLAAAAAQQRTVRGLLLPGPGLDSTPSFPPPPQMPVTWWQLAHHAAYSALGVHVLLFHRSLLPSWQLVLFMYIYGDGMSALLHAVFDHKDCLDRPMLGLDKVAYGFQMHHAWPLESTRGVGLYRICCDTVRIQWIMMALSALVCTLTSSSHLVLVGQILYLKLLFGAYGSSIGHFYAHVPRRERPRLVRLLQRLHLLLPHRHHAQHHRSPYDRHMASVSGLSEPLVGPLLKGAAFAPLGLTLVFLSFADVRLIEAAITVFR